MWQGYRQSTIVLTKQHNKSEYLNRLLASSIFVSALLLSASRGVHDLAFLLCLAMAIFVSLSLGGKSVLVMRRRMKIGGATVLKIEKLRGLPVRQNATNGSAIDARSQSVTRMIKNHCMVIPGWLYCIVVTYTLFDK